MRTITIVLLGLVLVGLASGVGTAASRVRVGRCCLVIPVPGVPDRATCVQLHVRRRLPPRLVCRLIGGRPLGPGDCTLAACDG